MSKLLNFAWQQRVKLRTGGDKLCAKGNKLWAEAVITKYGPEMTIEWFSTGCKLGNGKEFKDVV